ncbi:MAG: hypothetical protein R3E83_15325 [Burkholderiaceae bacterium]
MSLLKRWFGWTVSVISKSASRVPDAVRARAGRSLVPARACAQGVLDVPAKAAADGDPDPLLAQGTRLAGETEPRSPFLLVHPECREQGHVEPLLDTESAYAADPQAHLRCQDRVPMSNTRSTRSLDGPPKSLRKACHPDASALDTWRHLFKQNYRAYWMQERAHLGTSARPVLVRLDDELILCHNDRREAFALDDERYLALKAVSHLVPALVLRLLWNRDSGRPRVDDAELSELEHLLGRVQVDAFSERLHDACRAFVRDYRKMSEVSVTALESLGATYRDALRPILAEASSHALKTLDEAVRKSEACVDDASIWSALVCVVCSGHQPRYGELSKQFFARYLVSNGIGGRHWLHRLVYAEGRQTLDQALDLVAQRSIDARIGRLLLDGPAALDRDVLAQAAATTLDELFPEPPMSVR